MCGTCGCDHQDLSYVSKHTHHLPTHKKTISIEEDILAYNNQLAQSNRTFFQQQKILALNIMSSPGSGKTELLTKTLSALKDLFAMYVIVGDQQTDNDAKRLATTGATVKQINTGKSCHLDAHAILHTLENLSLPKQSILYIENVGNLVCPALFDLGEKERVVILSVTEGEDKPLKYPHMFHSSTLVVITKIDLLPYLAFDMDKCINNIKRINPHAYILQISTFSENNLNAWYHWIEEKWRTECISKLQDKSKV